MIMLIRHAESMLVSSEPYIKILSERGRKDAMDFILPLCMKPLYAVGGSVEFRSIETSTLIASANAQVPIVLGSNSAFGDEIRMMNEFGIDWKKFAEVRKLCSSNIEALKKVISSENINRIKEEIRSAIVKLANDFPAKNVLIGTHSPFLELAIEIFSNEEFKKEARNLDWIIIDPVDGSIANSSIEIL